MTRAKTESNPRDDEAPETAHQRNDKGTSTDVSLTDTRAKERALIRLIRDYYGLVGIVLAILGGYAYLNMTFAKRSEVQRLEQRVDELVEWRDLNVRICRLEIRMEIEGLKAQQEWILAQAEASAERWNHIARRELVNSQLVEEAKRAYYEAAERAKRFQQELVTKTTELETKCGS